MDADENLSPPAFRMSETDRTILGLLRQDSWRTISELAAIAGVSRALVKKRIDLMRDRGVIKRFTIEMGGEAKPELDCGGAFFLLRLKRPACRSVYASLRGWPEVLGCWSISGELDMIVLISARSNAGIEHLRERLSRHPDIKSLQTLAILRDWSGGHLAG